MTPRYRPAGTRTAARTSLPARAGPTTRPGAPAAPPSDHPRSRGADVRPRSGEDRARGPSPLTLDDLGFYQWATPFSLGCILPPAAALLRRVDAGGSGRAPQPASAFVSAREAAGAWWRACGAWASSWACPGRPIEQRSRGHPNQRHLCDPRVRPSEGTAPDEPYERFRQSRQPASSYPRIWGYEGGVTGDATPRPARRPGRGSPGTRSRPCAPSRPACQPPCSRRRLDLPVPTSLVAWDGSWHWSTGRCREATRGAGTPFVQWQRARRNILWVLRLRAAREGEHCRGRGALIRGR